MKKFASTLRRILLSISMILGLVICVSQHFIAPSLGGLLVLVLAGAAGAYLVISVLSIIVRAIARLQMDDDEKAKDSTLGVMVYYKNLNTLHYFRRLALWGVIMLIINCVAFNGNLKIFDGASSNDNFLLCYQGFLIWSVIALIVSFILTILLWIIFMPHDGDQSYNIFQFIGKMIFFDVLIPFTIIKALFIEKKYVLEFITMVLFIIVNAIAIIKIL